MSDFNDLEGFHALLTLPLLWGDMDAFSHVNSTRYFCWMEASRIAYLELVGMGESMQQSGWGPILAAANCNYRRQVTYPDTIFVGARVREVGRSSVAIEHRLLSKQLGMICAEGESKIVMFDYNNQQPMRVTDEIRAAIDAMQSSGN